MDATSREASSRSSALNSPFSEVEHIQCMSQITPVVVGISKISGLLKAADALCASPTGRVRRRYQSRPETGGDVIHRLHHLRPIEHKRGTINSRVGLGRGWEKFGQGVPVDSPRRKFKV